DVTSEEMSSRLPRDEVYLESPLSSLRGWAAAHDHFVRRYFRDLDSVLGIAHQSRQAIGPRSVRPRSPSASASSPAPFDEGTHNGFGGRAKPYSPLFSVDPLDCPVPSQLEPSSRNRRHGLAWFCFCRKPSRS